MMTVLDEQMREQRRQAQSQKQTKTKSDKGLLNQSE